MMLIAALQVETSVSEKSELTPIAQKRARKSCTQEQLTLPLFLPVSLSAELQ